MNPTDRCDETLHTHTHTVRQRETHTAEQSSHGSAGRHSHTHLQPNCPRRLLPLSVWRLRTISPHSTVRLPEVAFARACSVNFTASKCSWEMTGKWLGRQSGLFGTSSSSLSTAPRTGTRVYTLLQFIYIYGVHSSELYEQCTSTAGVYTRNFDPNIQISQYKYFRILLGNPTSTLKRVDRMVTEIIQME